MSRTKELMISYFSAIRTSVRQHEYTRWADEALVPVL
jgi:hypothetical protein